MFYGAFLFICLIAGLRAQDFGKVEPRCEYYLKNGTTRFPTNFKFGVATAAYQIEGGWNASGKGESIWDTFVHNNPDLIDDRSNGDVAADSYHRFDQDLEALKELGVDFYRFSISWPRILPSGDVSSLNPAGIAYYNMVIDKLIAAGITPMVTMFHYDMPSELNKLGGFTNPIFIDYFYNYADVLFRFFGDRVKTWGTFNEPSDYCVFGYGEGFYPPLVHSPGVTDYLCVDTTLKAHAMAYRLYKQKYFAQQRGKVGITLSTFYYLSRQSNQDDIDRATEFTLGWMANPIFSKDGDYPNTMLQSIIANSIREGRPWSRLRPLSTEWKELIKGSADFIGLNYYSSRYVEVSENDIPWVQKPSREHDSRVIYYENPEWQQAISEWLLCVPEGLEGVLNWIRDHYDNVEVIITENGWSSDGALEDYDRIIYLKAHLQAVLNAINNGCNVTGYTYWSLIDNFEWLRGYTQKFGLYYVNMTSPNLDRIPRESVPYYRQVIETHRIP